MGKEGRVGKKPHAACPPGLRLEPGTYSVLGESSQLHAMEVKVSLSVPIDRLRQLRNTM